MKNILFRSDSSFAIGTGHIMRDLVLASKYKKANIIFATQNLNGNINNKIIECGYKIEFLNSNSINELNEIIMKLNINLLVIDHYDFTKNKEKKLKIKNKKLKILSFDDTYKKHYCDILLNHNIYANKQQYKGLVPKKCKLKCGSKYLLLRNEFIKEKKKKTVFLAMGGSDTANLNLIILKILKQYKNIKVNVITTNANKNIEELRIFCKNESWINCCINSTKIAKLMKKSDFAIVTPSVTLNEIYFMGLPFIAIQTAKNQKYMYNYLIKTSQLCMKKFNDDKFQSLLKNLI